MANQGSLLELVARGKKDVFLTSNPKVSFFHSVYRKAAAFTEELYIMNPKNAPEWGRWMEFDFEHRGDLARKFYLRIQLPTWLPEDVVRINNRGIVTDTSGIAFGYCNNAGFHVIDTIQVYQDQILIQELYGEYLDWRLRQTQTLATTYVIAGSVGTRGEDTVSIARSAAPGLFRVPIPILGWENVGDPGFPTITMKSQRFRIRVLLRPFEDIIVASDGRAKPQPWSIPLHIQATPGGPIQTDIFTFPKSCMTRGKLTVQLETAQVYVPRDIQEWLRIQSWRIPYKQIQMQRFTIEDNQWNAAATSSVTNFSVPFRFDFIGPTSRLMCGLQSEGAYLAGQRTELLKNGVRFIRLNIANIDRVQSFPPAVFREVTAYWKNQRMGQDLGDPNQPHEVYTLTFDGGGSKYPAGTLNFSRSVEPELWFTLNRIPIDQRTKSRKSFLTVYSESWRIWEIKQGKGMMTIVE